MQTESTAADMAVLAAERRRLTPAAVQRHSRRIRFLRLVVPALAGGVIATYILTASPPQVDREFLREFEAIDVASRDVRLNKPRHVGYDLEGNAFEVAAATATQNPDRPDLIALDNPEAFRDGEGDESVKLRARAGLINTDTNRLDLSDEVQLDHRIGSSSFTLTTDAAEVDLDSQTVSSSVGVTGEGDRGSVAADRMTAYQTEGRLVLDGNVRFRLPPPAKKAERQE